MSKQIEQTKAVISGANGFIGKHLRVALEKQGIAVVAIPRGILLNPQALREFMVEHNPLYIFHLAAYGNHGRQKDALETVITNYMGTYNMLQASIGIDYKAFVNFGTSSEYGHKEEPMSELHRLDPNTFYSATKAGATYLARAFATQYNKPIITVRPFSVYGPGEADWRFIPTVCNAIFTGKKIPVVRYPQHDWIYIDDFIQGVMLAKDHPEVELLNVGTGTATTNHEILVDLSYISAKGIRTKENAYNEQPHHSRSWVADNAKLKALGWVQQYTLEQGLKLTFDYYWKVYAKQSPEEADLKSII